MKTVVGENLKYVMTKSEADLHRGRQKNMCGQICEYCRHQLDLTIREMGESGHKQFQRILEKSKLMLLGKHIHAMPNQT